MASNESVEAQVAATLARMASPMNRRAVLQLAAASGVTLTLAARMPGALAAAATKTGQVVNMVPTLANIFYKSWGDGYDSAASALGLTTKANLPNFEPLKELEFARGLKAAGASMLVGIAGDQSQVPNIESICQEQGIPYAPAFEDPPWFTPQDVGDNYVTFVTPRSRDAAYQTAKFLFTAIGGEGEVIHIVGAPGPTDTFRTQGVQLAASEFPGIKLVGKLRTAWTVETGRQAMLTSISANPRAKAVFAQNDTLAQGAIAVIKGQNLKGLKVVGMDAIPEVLPEIQDGNILIGSFNSLGGYIAGLQTVHVFDKLNGWTPKTPERLLETGGVLVTKDNVTQLKTKVYEDPHAFDWTKMSQILHPDDWDLQFEVQPADPMKLWNGFPKDLPLNPVWTKPGIADEIAAVQRLYTQHYVSGPLKSA
jgi:ribose transport system substrate-binding protein